RDDATGLEVVGLPRSSDFADDSSIRSALIFTPPDAAVADAVAQLPPANNLSTPGVAASVEAWEAAGRPQQAFRFRDAGEGWWGGFHAYTLGENTFWIAVVVPEADFLGDVIRQRNVTLAVSLVALLASLLMALVMSRTYGRPLEALANSSRRIRSLDLDAHAPVSSQLSEVSQLADAQQQMLATLQSFAKYVPLEVVRELVHRGEVAQIGGTSESLTILFTDISGFTTIAESMGPEALTAHMADYFREMLGILEAHGATVDKLIGDAIVAFWGAPRRDEQHAAHAMEAVTACADRLAECNQRWRANGVPELHTRFGLSTGTVIVGNVGATSRLSYTVLGDTVNLAARLEGLNRFYGTEVLVSEETRVATGEAFAWRLVDLVAVKGKRVGKRIYEPLGPAATVEPQRLAFARDYEAAWSIYQERRFDDARVAIQGLLAKWPDEASLLRLAEICQAYARNPPPADWDGVARMATK
ncbi:MAG: adenylate/guanylate cyclase domain-containing protein, partial [Pirellulales bacterium]|nr:adenylate/guanylate cyclase domain-containing protein [Pirellulales bacterium]